MVDPNAIRARFAAAMSAMYRAEVPQYGQLLALVAEVNRRTLDADPGLAATFDAEAEARLAVERHGAIRLGTPHELFTLRRLFAVMGMQPVGYYDLAAAGVPVHSTAFRPIDDAALAQNPFRVFTSLLRLELIEDPALRAEAASILASRRIFSDGTLALIDRAERDGGLGPEDAERFVAHALETFRWHSQATVALPIYRRLLAAHRLIADVVCFKGPHINHLTPRTLDIDAVQAMMPARGITPKPAIEGPPRRACPILLRQTSFLALEEGIRFADDAEGRHTARFGEIEQRGAALTAQGRALYDRLLAGVPPGPDHASRLARAFADLPDDWATLRRHELAFFRYRVGAAAPVAPQDTLDTLIDRGVILAAPILYEDFLPVSAAGIFQSNLGGDARHGYAAAANRTAFEQALGAPVHDEFALYAAAQRASLAATCNSLGWNPA